MPPAYEVLLLNTAIPQIQAAQTGDTYVVPRDIAFSAALTLSAGTANGVPYLNGSKVLTTGSALTFDGSIVSNTGVGFNVNNANALYRFQNGSGTRTGYFQARADAFEIWSDQAAVPMVFGTSNAEQMRLTSTGLGIGTPSPAQKLSVNGDALIGTNLFISNAAGSMVGATSPSLYSPASGTLGISAAGVERARISSDGTFRVKGAGTAGSTDAFQVAGTAPANAASIDSSGNLLVGATSTPSATISGIQIGPSSGSTIGSSGASTSTYNHWLFINGNGVVGSIQTNGSTTLYNTTSDHRLKTVVGPVADSGSRIDALQPVEYTWNADGSRTRGFLAHQFQEVYAGSVTGTKDAVDAEGKPVYQAMQASTPEVIADLVAEIQDLRKRLAAAGI
jgi:hypothetical protein